VTCFELNQITQIALTVNVQTGDSDEMGGTLKLKKFNPTTRDARGYLVLMSGDVTPEVNYAQLTRYLVCD